MEHPNRVRLKNCQLDLIGKPVGKGHKQQFVRCSGDNTAVYLLGYAEWWTSDYMTQLESMDITVEMACIKKQSMQ